MNELSEVFIGGRHGKKELARIRPWVMLVMPLLAILFQVYVPLYVSLLRYLELPLLMTVYLAMTQRKPLSGALIGAGIGLIQDSLAFQPIGILGMAKTIVGYSAASLGLRLDTAHAVVRFGLGVFFFLVHELLFWTLRHTLLGAPAGLELPQLLLAALANGILVVPLFHLLDKLRENV